MIPIERINIVEPNTDLWFELRLGRITAYNFYILIGKDIMKGKLTDGAITLIDQKVHEWVTGKPATDDISNANTDYGHAMEPETIRACVGSLGMGVWQPNGTTGHLIVEDDFSSSTPDSLVVNPGLDTYLDQSKKYLKAYPFEGKSPVGYKFIALYECTTPLDLEKTNKQYFWQMIKQMHDCNSQLGYFGVHNPDYTPSFKVIEFKKRELTEHFAKCEKALSLAKEEIKRKLSMFVNLKLKR